MIKTNLLFISLSFLAVSCGNNDNTSINSEKENKKDTTTDVSEAKPQAEAPPDSATMMKNWTAYMTPSKPHEMMASWNGTWSGDITMWHAPGTPPEKSKGTAVYKMMLGNRYQVGNFTGNMMGQPFEGMSTLAYDNAKKMFISTWLDNMGTGIMVLEGPWDESTKTMILKGKGIDPSAGNAREMDIREVFKTVDENTQVMEMYGPAPDGKEFKMMEITYSRKK